ncbi:hypothetical protein Ddc_07061 [Ditylenchus destructor]|nr:hypothetical protein Ddc_07061 [Ditylenchus destructor]
MGPRVFTEPGQQQERPAPQLMHNIGDEQAQTDKITYALQQMQMVNSPEKRRIKAFKWDWFVVSMNNGSA